MIRSFYLAENGAVTGDLTPEQMREALDTEGTLWVDFLHATPEEIELLTKVFHFHPLAVDDCVKPLFRPKVDAFQDYIFLVAHGADPTVSGDNFRTRELDSFLGRNYLVTFHEMEMRSVASTFEQCHANPAQTLGRGPDFLLYNILDRMAENFEPLVRRAEITVVDVEQDVMEMENRLEVLQDLMKLGRELLSLRRVVTAQRDALALLAQEGPPLISLRARAYFRDLQGLYQRALEDIEIQRDAITGARATLLAMMNNRVNEVIKVLTIITTITLPMTVVSGIYGMNFRFMPELTSKYGYVFALLVMAGIAAGMLLYFRRKRWL